MAEITVAALTGQKITKVRAMTGAEMESEGWDENNFHGAPVVIVTEDGTRIYPSRDEEGNGAGALFACSPRRDYYRVEAEA